MAMAAAMETAAMETAMETAMEAAAMEAAAMEAAAVKVATETTVIEIAVPLMEAVAFPEMVLAPARMFIPVEAAPFAKGLIKAQRLAIAVA